MMVPEDVIKEGIEVHVSVGSILLAITERGLTTDRIAAPLILPSCVQRTLKINSSFVKERNDKASLCRRMSHSKTAAAATTTTIIIIINNSNNKTTFLTSQQFSWFSTECVSNAQALLVHCSAKTFQTVWRVLNITASCIRIYSAGRRLSSFNLPRNLLRITPVVDISIICRVLGLDRTVAASSNNIFRGLQSRILLIDLNFSIIFGILLLLILVTCRSHFDFYLLCFQVTGSTFNSPKISLFLLFG